MLAFFQSQVETKRATPREEFGKPEAGQTVNKVFVGGIKDEISEADIRTYFEQFGGKIVNINLLTDKDTGKPRGFGFVEFDDYDPVDKAILKANHQINGRRVDVKKAVSKQDMGGGGGGMGGGRGGRRGGGGGGGGNWNQGGGGGGGGGRGNNYGGQGWGNQGGGGGNMGGYGGMGGGSRGQGGGYGGGEFLKKLDLISVANNIF